MLSAPLTTASWATSKCEPAELRSSADGTGLRRIDSAALSLLEPLVRPIGELISAKSSASSWPLARGGKQSSLLKCAAMIE